MKKITIPEFRTDEEEANWWESAEGRNFLRQQSGRSPKKQSGSALVSDLNSTRSIQIALRLPAPDISKAREIAARKGIGYQTLLKMLVHEGLRREGRRK